MYRTWLAISDRKDEGIFLYESDGAHLGYENWQNSYGIDRGVLDTTHECAYVFANPTYTWYTDYCNHHYITYRYICETIDWVSAFEIPEKDEILNEDLVRAYLTF